MATVKHVFVNPIADEPGFPGTKPSDWNADHDITGLVAADVGLGNVDNTSDANKPVSTAQATAIAVVQTDINAHEANTSNPHSVTAAQVGAPSGSGTSTGTNTGDQTSIVGITGTMAQFNTAITDGDIQPLDATLTALAGANWVNNALPIGSGADTVAQITMAANRFPARASTGALIAKTISDDALAFLAAANNAAMRTALGVGAGDVVGPASSVDNQLARYSGITGKLLDSVAGATLNDSADLSVRDVLAVGTGTIKLDAQNTSTGYTLQGSVNSLRVLNAGAAAWLPLSAFSVLVADTGKVGFGNSSNPEVSDTAFGRNAEGVAEINNGTGGTFRDLLVRQHYVDQTITAGGTTGNQTINKAAGTVNIAGAGTTVTVTCNRCTMSSTVHATIRTNDATARVTNVVPAAGSFVINIVACTAEVSIGFLVIN